VSSDGAVLALDIGCGTQDILVWEPNRPMENCPKMILPSPTSLVAQEIQKATRRSEALFLWGYTMGGGPSCGAVRRHLEAGLGVYASKDAALTFHDDVKRLQAMGIQLREAPPALHPLHQVFMGDVDLKRIRTVLELFSLRLPSTLLVAVQDHGFSPGESNRAFRFRHWKEVLETEGRLEDLLYQDPPAPMTRMRAVKRQVPGAWVMDTGPSAILGALEDPQVRGWAEEGVTVLNIGNEHVLGALVKKERLWGIYEHHRGLLDGGTLRDHLERFRRGLLSHEEVFHQGGHGCYILPGARKISDFCRLSVTGPHRAGFELPGAYLAAPHGDMMLTGCFGLLVALRWQLRKRGDNAQ